MFVIGVYTWRAWSISGQPPDQPQEVPKDKILFLISKFNFITEKSNKLKYIKAIFSDLPPDLELDLLEQDPSCPTNFISRYLKLDTIWGHMKKNRMLAQF